MVARNKSIIRQQYSGSSLSQSGGSSFAGQNLDEVSRKFKLLAEEVPELGSNVLWSLASSGQPDAMLMESAVRALDLGKVKTSIENLKEESIEQQKTIWEGMSSAKQQIYLDNGYSVPKESSPWWKSALGTAFTPVKAVGAAIGKAWDVSGADSTIGKAVGGVATGVGGLFNAMTWIQDQGINRPFRALVDTSAQNMESRLDLTFEEARQSLEKKGVRLNASDWDYLKWKYVEVNGLSRVQYGHEGDNPQGAAVARLMMQGNPGGGAALGVLDALTEINQVADIARDIPLVGKLVKDPKTENPYDSRARSSGSGISDAVYEMFNNEVKKLSENEDYNLSPWSAWNRASNGNSMIDPTTQVSTIQKLRQAGLDAESFDYAMYRSKGKSADEWLNDVEGITADDPRYQQRRYELAQKWEGQKVVQEAIGDLSASGSKYSIGRGYAHAFGIPEDSAAFTAISGLADAAVVMTLDPTLFLGKANKIWRVVRKGVQLADLARIRWFAKGLIETGNILDRPIIEGIENISKVRTAVNAIDETIPVLEAPFERSKLSKIDDLIDENGLITDFAIENYDDLTLLVDDAQKTLLSQRAQTQQLIDDLTNGTWSTENVVTDLNTINEQLDALEITKQVLNRIPPAESSIKEVGKFMTGVRVRQAEKYNRYIETVTDGFKKLRNVDDDSQWILINDLKRALPYGNDVVEQMVKYDKESIARGFAGMDNYDTVWDFIESSQMLWGGGRGTGQAVRGFGNGSMVRDSWRVFSNGLESAVFDRNAYTMLPELSKTGVYRQKFYAKSDQVIEEIKRLKNVNLTYDKNISKIANTAIRVVSKPARMTASLLWNLTHHVPKSNGMMSLTGPDAVAEFEKLLNMGTFAGLTRKDKDIFMGQFILGFGEDRVERWIFNGTASEGKKVFDDWQKFLATPEANGLVDALREYAGTKFDIDPRQMAKGGTESIEASRAALEDIFHPSGQLTQYGIDHIDNLKAIVYDMFEGDLDNPAVQIFNRQVAANGTSSTLAARFMAERLFLEDLFKRTGMYEVPGAKETIDRFLNNLMSHRYAPNDLDLVGLGESAQRVGLLPVFNYSEAVSIPSFVKDIQKNATQLGFLSKTIRRTFNSDSIETIMGTYWKPLTLLRLGFVPRAAGEEFLAFFARAGIWAPLSFAATQTAADRRGVLSALVNLPGRLTAKQFGELSRAGLDDDIWKLSAMVPYTNVSAYINSVAKKAAKVGKKLNGYDHLGLYSAYWTGTVSKNLKQIQFRALPKNLQAGIVASMTPKNEEWIKNGIVTMEGLNQVVRSAADAAIRDPYFQQGIAAAHVDSGRTAAPNPLDDPSDKITLEVRSDPFSSHTEKVEVQVGHEYESVAPSDATVIDRSYIYSHASQETTLNPVYDFLSGAVDESTLEGAIGPIFRGTEFEVKAVVREAETITPSFTGPGLEDEFDLFDVSNISRSGVAEDAPDILDRYVDTLRVRAEGLAPAARVESITEGEQTLLSTARPEFTVEAEVALDNLPARTVTGDDGLPVTTADDEWEASYTNVLSQLSDRDVLQLQAQTLIDKEIAESAGREIDEVKDDLINKEWDSRQASKKFQPEQVREYLDQLRLEGRIESEPYDLVEVLVPVEDITKKPFNIPAEVISRERIVADLRRIANRQATPERSIWFNPEIADSSEEADQLQRLAQVVFERGQLEAPAAEVIAASSRLRAEDVVDSIMRFQTVVNNLPRKTRKRIAMWVQGSDAVPNGTGFIPNFGELDALLTPEMRAASRHTSRNSGFDSLLQQALDDINDRNDKTLFNVLDVLLRLQGSRYRQILISDSAIRIARKDELIPQVKELILASLNDPHFAKQVRGSRRYLVNSNSARPMAVPSGANSRQMFYVEMPEQLGNALAADGLDPKDLNKILDTARAAGYDEEVVQSLNHILLNLDSDLQRSLGDGTVLRSGDLVPISSIGFTDYDHAQEVAKALEIGYPVNKEFPEAADEAGRIIRVGASNTPRNADNVVRIPNSQYAYQTLDDGVLHRARPLNSQEVRRFDDGGFLDDMGNLAIEGGTIEENIDAWADKLTQYVSDIMFSRKGEVMHEVLEPIRRGTFAVDAVAQIPMDDLPAVIYRPKKFVPPKEKFITKVARIGFGRVVNPAIFALVRHPMYLLAFSNGYEFARANNILFRNKGLDEFAQIWSKKNNVDLDEFRNLWAMIPEAQRNTINGAYDFNSAIVDLAVAGKVDLKESTMTRFIDDIEFGKLSKEQRTELKSAIDWVRMDQNVERINTRVAMDRAMSEMVPYIDDHQVRSFFQEYARNIMPFEFAQEQFLKRWAYTISYSPESLRRVQLLAHAFTNNGFIEEQNGQKYFVIPGTEALNSLLATAPVLDTLFGGNIQMPTAIPMGLNTKNVLPGIPSDLENLPAFSPIAMFGVEQLSNHFPEIKKIAQEFNGGRPIESDDNILDAIVDFIPQNYQRLYAGLSRGYAALPNGIDGEFNRNAIAAVQQAAAEAERLRIEQRDLLAQGRVDEASDMQRRINDLDPPANATKDQIERWLDTIKDWTRANMFVRGALGFVLPTTATNIFEGKTLANEFGQLLQQMDFDTALATFLAEHPDGAAYTVFTSSKNSKAPMPRTEQAIKWMQDNKGWMEAFPLATPWLVPQSKAKDDFSQQAYVDALGMGLRNMKDINQWYGDFKFAAGANVYFPAKEQYELAKAQATSVQQRAFLDARWQAESELIKKQHPLFAEKLGGMISTESQSTMEELRKVLRLPDSELPDVEHIEGLREAVNSWDIYVGEYSRLAGKNSKAARTKRENLRTGFLQYGQDFLLRYPEMRSFWNSIVISSLELTSKKKLFEMGVA